MFVALVNISPICSILDIFSLHSCPRFNPFVYIGDLIHN